MDQKTELDCPTIPSLHQGDQLDSLNQHKKHSLLNPNLGITTKGKLRKPRNTLLSNTCPNSVYQLAPVLKNNTNGLNSNEQLDLAFYIEHIQPLLELQEQLKKTTEAALSGIISFPTTSTADLVSAGVPIENKTQEIDLKKCNIYPGSEPIMFQAQTDEFSQKQKKETTELGEEYGKHVLNIETAFLKNIADVLQKMAKSFRKAACERSKQIKKIRHASVRKLLQLEKLECFEQMVDNENNGKDWEFIDNVKNTGYVMPWNGRGARGGRGSKMHSHMQKSLDVLSCSKWENKHEERSKSMTEWSNRASIQTLMEKGPVLTSEQISKYGITRPLEGYVKDFSYSPRQVTHEKVPDPKPEEETKICPPPTLKHTLPTFKQNKHPAKSKQKCIDLDTETCKKIKLS